MKSLKVPRTVGLFLAGLATVVVFVELASKTAMAQGGGVAPPVKAAVRGIPSGKAQLPAPQSSGLQLPVKPAGPATQRLGA